MSRSTLAPISSESRSNKTFLRTIDGQTTEETVSITGATFTFEFSKAADILRDCKLLITRRPNRSQPIHCSGFQSIDEKAAWETASDEAWDSIDD